jgi:adenylate cyclase
MSSESASNRTRTPAERRLAAVVHADMVGYSRLIGLDDVGTLERLRTLRRDLIDPAIAEHSGRVVNTGGDSLLMVFDSADGAVRCAVKVQQQLPSHDGDRPPEARIRFRIGINVGDVIVDGSDVHGEGVNVAARLQAECPPGGICVSRGVRDHVRGRLDLAFEGLGALNLKNIAEPVEAFVLRTEVAATTPNAVERSLVHGTGEALPLPDKPSIAVLAFTNMSGDPEQEYFSDGIADDIITELSRSRSLFVIARNSSFTYKGRAVDIKQAARELGVRYVLEGSVRRSGGRVRVVAQLIEGETNNHIWAERYDRALEDVFAVQDEITAAAVTAILPAVADAELRRGLRKPPENLGAWEAYQRGLWHIGKANAADNERAKQFLQHAVAQDATFAPAYVAMSLTYQWQGAVFATLPLQECGPLARGWAEKAVELDPNDADAHAMLAWCNAMEGINDGIRDGMLLAVALNPNSSWAHAAMGSYWLFAGQPSQAREALLTALRLNTRDPLNAVPPIQVSLSYYFERDYANAAEAARRAVAQFPGMPLAHRNLAAALGQLGRTREAHAALQRAIEVSPTSFDLYVRSRPRWFSRDDHEHLLEGLRKAGWQG